MVSTSERGGIGQPKRVGWSKSPERNNREPPDVYGARGQQPDRAIISRRGRRYSHIRHGEGSGNDVSRDAIGNDGGNLAIDYVDIERSQLDKPVDGIVRRGRNVDPI